MLKRSLISLLTLAALAVAAPGVASAADTVIVPGAEAQRMTALDGTLVWITGSFPNQRLIERAPDGTVAPVVGAPVGAYRSIDLGHDGNGELVLTYIRCVATRNCKAFSDDLHGNRTTYKKLVPKRCALTSAPSRWGSRVAYGLSCDKLRGEPGRHDAKRSGLFVRKGSAAAKRLKLPRDAVRFGIDFVRFVDLRGTNVGAVAADVYSYMFAQTINGNALRSVFIAGSEGDSDENVVGMSLVAGGVLWALVDATHSGDPLDARINRMGNMSCAVVERLTGAPDDERYRAEAMAVDGSTVYLFTPGVGIVTHDFVPSSSCL